MYGECFYDFCNLVLEISKKLGGYKKMYCPKCGTKNPDGAIYCENCGNRLEVDNTQISSVNRNGDEKKHSNVLVILGYIAI